jgi:DNA repair and recombination protein RAD52
MAIQLTDDQQVQGFTAQQQEMLHAPLDASVIKHRPGGGGKMLRYLKGDTAIDTANKIFGFGGWGYKVVSRSHELIQDEKKGTIEFYTADIELSVVGATFPFPGDGVGIVTAPFTVEMHEKARKEATTDALKRALRHYGDQFGLCLYDEDDYVEAADGSLVQVKDVKPGAKQAQPKRVIEAAPAPKQLSSPQEDAPATEQQLASIHKLYQHLGQEVPQSVNALNYAGAKRLLIKLTEEYKAKRAEPVPLDKIPVVSQLHAQCDVLFGNGKWEEVQAKLFGKGISDEEMTPEHCQKMHRSFEVVEQRRFAAKQAEQAKAS